MRKIENQKIKASKIQPGMILKIYGSERFEVEQATANEYGAVIIKNWLGETRGLGENETVEILGYYNP